MSARSIRGVLATLALGAFALGAAGCGTPSSEASGLARTSMHDPPTTTTTRPEDPKCSDAEKATMKGHELESYAPDRTLAPGQLPAGAAKNIFDRGRLVVGVDENTPYFGVRNDAGQLEGLEIDLVRQIAKAIFPDAANIDDKIQWKTVVTEEKVPYARDGKVDMTVSVVTINCDRWKQVAFSTPYFSTVQRVLVRDASDIHSLADLDGRRVCVTAGSTTIDEINRTAPKAVAVPVEARTDCLVKLQEGKVDAIATHDTILFGLRQQEGPPTRILPGAISPTNYGIAMKNAQDDRSLVRVVNGVLEQMRADGRLAGLYDEWLTSRGYCPATSAATTPPCDAPLVPPATYRDES